MYLITSSLARVMNGGIKDPAAVEHNDGIILVPRVTSKVSNEKSMKNSVNLYKNIQISQVALTFGDWEVLGRNVWVDTARQLVYFLGLRETPLEKHLYVVSLQKEGSIRLLTVPGNSYSIDFNKVKHHHLSQIIWSN